MMSVVKDAGVVIVEGTVIGWEKDDGAVASVTVTVCAFTAK